MYFVYAAGIVNAKIIVYGDDAYAVSQHAYALMPNAQIEAVELDEQYPLWVLEPKQLEHFTPRFHVFPCLPDMPSSYLDATIPQADGIVLSPPDDPVARRAFVDAARITFAERNVALDALPLVLHLTSDMSPTPAAPLGLERHPRLAIAHTPTEMMRAITNLVSVAVGASLSEPQGEPRLRQAAIELAGYPSLPEKDQPTERAPGLGWDGRIALHGPASRPQAAEPASRREPGGPTVVTLRGFLIGLGVFAFVCLLVVLAARHFAR